MDVLPQVQSIISSKDVSTAEAQRVLKNFLSTQKTFFLEHDTEPVNENDDNVEEYFNMDDKEDRIGYGEFEQRIGAMIDSLSDDYFSQKKTTKLEEENSPQVEVTDTIMEENDADESFKEEAGLNEPSANIKQEVRDSPSATNPKGKLNKAQEKERKKQHKKEMKEKKKKMKKEAKQAKKAEKEKQKKLKKDKKEKREREQQQTDENSTAKRLKV